MQSTPYSCQILMKLEFSCQVFVQFSNIKFHEKPSDGSGYDPRGRTNRLTDRHDEAKSRF